MIVALTLLSTPSIIKLQSFCTEHRKLQEEHNRRSLLAQHRFHRIRRNWQEFKNSITKNHFRRMFRMSVECFDSLSKITEQNIGPEQFKSEEYIKLYLHDDCTSRNSKMYHAHKKLQEDTSVVK